MKYISPNCFWNRFSVAAVNEVGEGPEAKSTITTSSPAGMNLGCSLCNIGKGDDKNDFKLRDPGLQVDLMILPLLPK